MSVFARQQLVPALREQWEVLDELLTSLPAAEWSLSSGLPGWSVKDVVAHLIGTESELSGQDTPEVDVDVTGLTHVHNKIGARNECWVRALRPLEPGAVLERFRAVTSQRGEALEAMSQEDFDAPAMTPAGQATYGRFMRIRQFDCWMHELDIRHAVGRPCEPAGLPAEIALDEITAALGYVVGKLGQAPEGASVTFDVTGPASRTVHLVVEGRAKVVPELSSTPTVTIRLDTCLLARLAGGRTSAAEHSDSIDLHGDTEIGQRIVDNLAYTI